MALFKNPFKKESSDQLTPEFKLPEKVKEKELAKEKKLSKEKASEKIKEIKKEKIKAEKEKPSLTKPPTDDSAAQATPAQKSVQLQKIENILQQDLEEVYFKMDQAHRRLVKEEGERAARQIESVLQTGRSVAVKVLEIIKRWLKLIPGVNKFFIEQEAKIKTDKIIRINSKQ